MIPPAAPLPAAPAPALPVDGRAAQGEAAAFPTVLLALASFGTQPAAAATPALPGGDGPGGGAEHAGVGVEAVVSCEAGCTAPDEIAALVAEAMAVWGGSASPAGHAPDGSAGEAEGLEAHHPAATSPTGASGSAAAPAVAPSIEASPAALEAVLPALASAPAVAPAAEVLDLEASAPLPQEAPQVADEVSLDTRMLRRLSRDFVPRLRRVAERMWNEHGMRVQIVEGYRSQNRQDALFAQGRTTDGPVVTWTRSSLHTSGAAADVYIDGAPVTAQQARLLARVAAEEGLRTLYPYDSGHIQMEGGRAMEGPDMPGDQGLPAPASGAPVRRSGIAPVAPVARPARPARPGGEKEGADAPEARSDAARLSGRGVDAARGSGAAALERAGIPTEGAEREPGAGALGTRRAAAPATGSGPEPAPVLAPAAPAGASASTARASAVEGAGEITPPLPPDPPDTQQLLYRRVRLPIEGVDGRASLDLGVRPGSIDAQLNVSDPRLADDLQRGLHELRQLLAERGVETRGLSVRLTPQAAGEVQSADGTAALRATADGSAGQSSAGSGRGGGQKLAQPFDRRDDPSQPGRQHRPQEDPDGPDS